MTSLRRSAWLSVYRAGSDVFGKAAFFLVTVLAARRLSQDAFGVFSLGTTIGWITAVASDLGIQLHTARAVAQHPDRAVEILRTWRRIRLVTAAIAVIALALGLFATSRDASVAVALFLLALVYIAAGLVEFLYYFFRSIGRSDLESTLTIAQRSGTLLLAGVALWMFPNLTVLALALLLPMGATLTYASIAAGRLAGVAASASGGSASDVSSPRPGDPRESAAAVLTMGVAILLSALYFRIDVFLVNAWNGTAAVALYNAVFRVVDALRLLPAAVVAVALPRLFAAGDRQPMTVVAAALTAGAIAVSLGLFAIADRLIPGLYGDPYREAVPAFRVLLVSFPLMSLNYVLTHQLLGWHGQRGYLAICATALAFNVITNIRVLPAFGILGAAWATVGTEVVITVGCLAALSRIRTPLTHPVIPAAVS